MQKHNLNKLIEFNSSGFNAKVLVNEPGYRMVLLCLSAGQSVPEHSTPGNVTVHSIRGYIAFYEKDRLCELHEGEVLNVAPGSRHRLSAYQDSVLLVLAIGNAEIPSVPVGSEEELDLREIPRPQRHSLIFAKFDALPGGSSLLLLNDHDPIPLGRQFETVRPGQASWEYIERGPALFRIRIQRIASPSLLDIPPRAPQNVHIDKSV